MKIEIPAAELKHPNRCPCCGADDINYGGLDFESGAVIQEWYCTACDAEGHDWYDLTSRIITNGELN